MVDRQFSDRDFIYKSGDPADGVFRIRSGEVRLEPPAGGLVPVELCGSGDIFGGDGFLTGDTRGTDAVAVGPVTVEFIRRNEFLAILTLQPHLLSPVFDPVFDMVAAAAGGSAAPDPVTHDPAMPDLSTPDLGTIPANGVVKNGSFGIRLVVDGKRLRAALGVDEIEISKLPFRIGRAASGEGKDTYTDIHLTISDSRPFNLSRRHFAIEAEEDGALIVRDFGSYHGTTVNGMTLGGDGRPRTAPLMTGESELVAGKPDSPFRFRILVE
jgi:hypothetical protein